MLAVVAEEGSVIFEDQDRHLIPVEKAHEESRWTLSKSLARHQFLAKTPSWAAFLAIEFTEAGIDSTPSRRTQVLCRAEDGLLPHTEISLCEMRLTGMRRPAADEPCLRLLE